MTLLSTASETPTKIRNYRSPQFSITQQGVELSITRFKELSNVPGNLRDILWFGDYFSQQSGKNLSPKLNKIRAHNTKLTQGILTELGIDTEGFSRDLLFESPGAVTQFSDAGQVIGANFSGKNSFSNGRKGEDFSDISEVYDHNFLRRMSFEKALFHLYLSCLGKQGQELDVKLAQDEITRILGKTYFRGGYYNGETSTGCSASSLNEKIVLKLFQERGGFGDDSLKQIAEKLGCNVVDLLAGIGDELMSRLVASDTQDYITHVKAVAHDLGKALQSGEKEKILKLS